MKRFTIVFLSLLMLIAAIGFSSQAQAGAARCYKLFSHVATTALDTFEVTGYENGDYVLGMIVHTNIATSSVAAKLTFRTAIGDTLLEMTVMDEITAGAAISLDANSGQMPFAVGQFPGLTASNVQHYCMGGKFYVIYDPQDATAGWVTLYICVKRD